MNQSATAGRARRITVSFAAAAILALLIVGFPSGQAATRTPDAMPGAARPSPTPGFVDRSDLAYRAGLVAYANGQYGYALTSFEQARSLAPLADPKIDQMIERSKAALKPSAIPIATASVPAEKPITVAGRDSMKTRPFALTGGNYTVGWQGASQSGSAFCGGRLSSLDDGAGDSFVSTMIDSERRGESKLFHVKPGQYFVDMHGCGDWKVAIAPLGTDTSAALDSMPATASEASASGGS
jgi:hypothetical protein